ncbi:MAG: cupin domain-containing protein [Candidatus Obscuribacterales bacterium]|nr:cupin domain-containing protein [Candidatus Obscuribacterales bacterium]
MTAEELIEFLQLEPLTIEGGYFRRTYCADETIAQKALPERYKTDKALSSCIYYLLTPDTFSEFHMLATDEIYHFYLGDPINLIEISQNGELKTTVLGQDIMNGQEVQHAVPRNTWQASQLQAGGKFALLGCTLSPAYDFADHQKGNWEAMLRQFPMHHQTIMRLTRK